MWQELSRSEKQRVIMWLGFVVPFLVGLAVLYMSHGRWVTGVVYAALAVLFAFTSYKTVTSERFRGHWRPRR